MQIPEGYRASGKALKSTRAMIALGSVLICTACANDGESTDLHNDPGKTDPLPPTGSLTPLSEEYWEDTLERALEIVGTDIRNILFDAAVALRYPTSSSDAEGGISPTDELLTIVLSDGTPGAQETANCVAGGEFRIVTTSSDFKRALIDADECVLDSWVISGQVERLASDTEVESLKFHEFDVGLDNLKVSVSSALYEFDNEDPFYTRSWSGMTYSVEESGRITTVHELELESVDIYGYVFDKSLSMNFTANGPWTSDRPLRVSTPVPFGGLTTSETGRDYTTGKLVLESGDVNRLTLDVDSGEPGRVLITLERDGVVTTFFRPLPDALR